MNKSPRKWVPKFLRHGFFVAVTGLTTGCGEDILEVPKEELAQQLHGVYAEQLAEGANRAAQILELCQSIPTVTGVEREQRWNELQRQWIDASALQYALAYAGIGRTNGVLVSSWERFVLLRSYMNYAIEQSDSTPYDAQGFVGASAVERVLFAPGIRPELAAKEESAAFAFPARRPQSDAEVLEFCDGLLGQWSNDFIAIEKTWHESLILLENRATYFLILRGQPQIIREYDPLFWIIRHGQTLGSYSHSELEHLAAAIRLRLACLEFTERFLQQLYFADLARDLREQYALLLEELEHIRSQSKSLVIFDERPDETELDVEQLLWPWFDPTRYRSIGFLERELEAYFIVHHIPVEPLPGDDLE